MCMKTLSDPRENRLLFALSDTEWHRWLPNLEPADMALGQVIYESGETLSQAYLATTAIVSMHLRDARRRLGRNCCYWQ